MRISHLIRNELQSLREECNFTDEEMAIFNMLAKECTICEISRRMNMSERTVNRRIACIYDKIKRKNEYDY